jgi:hypothetical protein
MIDPMTSTHEADLIRQTEFNPDILEADFSLKDLIATLEAAAVDGNAYFQTMLQAEKWRLCEWDGKDPKRSGRRVSLPGMPAKPYTGAPDHEVFHIQEHLNYRRLLRRAVLAGGRVNVSAHEVNDAREAGLLQSALRWLSAGPEGEAINAGILRGASYMDRFNHALVYVGWERQMGLRPLVLTREQVVELLSQTMNPTMEGEPVQIEDDSMAEEALLTPSFEPQLAELLYRSFPGLSARGKAGQREAGKAARRLMSGADQVVVHESYERVNRPEVLALRYGVDYLIQANTPNDPRLRKAPMVALWRPYSAAQLKARAMAEEWDDVWLAKVLSDHAGQPNMVVNQAQAHVWSTHPRWRSSLEAMEHTYFILEVWEQACTADGCLAIHRTVLHPDYADKCAVREVTRDWHGCYPFVAMSVDPDEALLLEPMSISEILHTAQDAIKAQADSRSAAAAMTTLPPRIGDPEARAIPVEPNGFVGVRKGERLEFMQMPAPDGRSIEIEKSLTAYSDRLMGKPADAVPEIISRMAAEDTTLTFLASVSHVYWLLSQLLGQYLSPLEWQQVTGTQDVPAASAERIRRFGYDVSVKFDPRGLSPEYVEMLLNYGTKAVQVLDRRAEMDSLPMLRTLLNWMDPSLADQCLPTEAEATQRQKEAAIAALNDILNGGSPTVFKVQNPAGMAQVIVEEVQRSPLRQQIIMGNEQIRTVLGSYLQTLAAQAVQQDENPVTGLTLGEDPLRQDTPAEQMSAMLLGKPQAQAPVAEELP